MMPTAVSAVARSIPTSATSRVMSSSIVLRHPPALSAGFRHIVRSAGV
jgi:hypothetical protein